MPVFQKQQLIKADLGSCWDFFSDPANLSLITPPGMNFTILFPDPLHGMYPGMIIRYKVSPLLRIPVEWITEITQVREREFFIDNQVKGPFRLWHHQHLFRETANGTEMRDIVNFELPFGFIGRIGGSVIVQKRIEAIFRFREAFINSHFRG